MVDFAHVEDEKIRSVLAHWLDVRGDRLCPSRTDLDPLNMRAALEIVFILDFEAESRRLRYRLSGEKVNDVYGVSLAGRYLDEILGAEAYEKSWSRNELLIKVPYIRYNIGYIYGQRREIWLGQRLLLPLVTNGRSVDGILGVVVFTGRAVDTSFETEHYTRTETNLWTGEHVKETLRFYGEPPILS